jgi:hypothetical protein
MGKSPESEIWEICFGYPFLANKIDQKDSKTAEEWRAEGGMFFYSEYMICGLGWDFHCCHCYCHSCCGFLGLGGLFWVLGIMG